MPRTLARLRFRAPKPSESLSITGLFNSPRAAVVSRLRSHVLQQSKPSTHFQLMTVVDQKWKQKPKHSTKPLPRKPHTLRDLVDPEGTSEHGQIIYVFRHLRTGQVIYSFVEQLDNHHLEQLPFIGNNSKPPALRPDQWAPHCVITFPSANQGQHAFRKLREFRRLHETAWDKTNPEWIKLPHKQRMWKIMDQVAFTSADLAEVLSMQEQQCGWMEKRYEERQRLVEATLSKKWPEIEALAEASQAENKRDGDNVEWLKKQIEQLKKQLTLKKNNNETDQTRLNNAIHSHETRVQKILFAQRKAPQMKKMQAKLYALAAPALEPGAEDALKELQRDVDELKEEVAQPSFPDDDVQIAFDRSQLQEKRAALTKLKRAFAAKKSADERTHFIAHSILPHAWRKPLPKPFTMDNIEIKWAELRDAEYAAGKWPAAVVHNVLPLRQASENVTFLNTAEYHAMVEDEVRQLTRQLEREARGEAGLEDIEDPAGEFRLGEAIRPPEEKKGVWKYLPALRNPFSGTDARKE